MKLKMTLTTKMGGKEIECSRVIDAWLLEAGNIGTADALLAEYDHLQRILSHDLRSLN